MKSFILISGAAGGLGSAMTTEFARRGYNLLLTDLREDVSGFADFIGKTFKIEARGISCDLTSPQSRTDLMNTLKLEGNRFSGLVNVAGLDFEGVFLDRTRDQILRLIHLNIEATVDLTHEIINLRDPETRFMLINVCSLAAITPMPYKATYAATKRFLLDFSLALREEIKEYGTVTALCPAGMPTTVENMEGIFAQGFWGAVTTVDARTVARMTVDAAEKGKAVVVPGWLNRMIYEVSRLLPASVTARIAGNRWRAAQQVSDPWKEYMRAGRTV
ncbi:MAG: SDR family NAD(P)-dependent oxidoreductase [Chloroflexi bacterium]|nr:SDR family NAD(P)-dependent oxidoreductase [Chloroflexota bacterium]BCY17277.1 short-chain dehydrogenase [Leptolinea sp. HRD-7]